MSYVGFYFQKKNSSSSKKKSKKKSLLTTEEIEINGYRFRDYEIHKKEKK